MPKRALVPVLLLLAASACLAQGTPSPREREILDRLETTRVTMDFREAPLEDVLEYLRTATGVDLVLSPDASTRPVTIRVKDLPAGNVLRLVLRSMELDHVFRSGVLVVTSAGSAGERIYTQVYDVRDLLFGIRDFAGPNISLGRSGDGFVGCFFGPDPEAERRGIESDEVLEVIRANVAPGSWDRPETGLSLASGHLVVRQTRAAHEEVRRMLDLLRAQN